MNQLLVLRSEEREDLLSPALAHVDGLTLHSAASVEEALELLRAHRTIRLILTDPGADPFEILLKAKELAPQARALVCTEEEPVDTLPGAPDAPAGVVRYLQLPQQLDLLVERVNTLFAAAQQERHAIEHIELLDIVQLACLARRTAVLHLRYENRKGRIAFERGHIVHAEFMERSGPEALHQLVALRQGNMFLQVGASSEARSIDQPWQDLIRQATVSLQERRERFDEEDDARRREDAITESDVNDLLQINAAGATSTSSGEIRGGGSLFDADDLAELGDLDDLDASPTPAPTQRRSRTGTAPSPRAALAEAGDPHSDAIPFRPPTPGQRAAAAAAAAAAAPAPAAHGTAQTLQQLVQSFAEEIPEFIATDLVHIQDGLSLLGASATPDYDSPTACAYYADILRACARATEDYADESDMEDVQLTTRDAYIILRALRGTPYMQLLLMHRTGNLGIGRVTMRRFEPLFAQALNPTP